MTDDEAASQSTLPILMPIQPIHTDESGCLRFIGNRIVRRLLDDGPFDLNQIALWSVSQQEHIQFAQLIGYSVDGFGSLSYVDDATYDAVQLMKEGIPEDQAKLDALREQLVEIRRGLKIASSIAFGIHEDDLDEG